MTEQQLDLWELAPVAECEVCRAILLLAPTRTLFACSECDGWEGVFDQGAAGASHD